MEGSGNTKSGRVSRFEYTRVYDRSSELSIKTRFPPRPHQLRLKRNCVNVFVTIRLAAVAIVRNYISVRVINTDEKNFLEKITPAGYLLLRAYCRRDQLTRVSDN